RSKGEARVSCPDVLQQFACRKDASLLASAGSVSISEHRLYYKAMDISNDRDSLRNLLESARRIAVVGSSPNPARDSHAITKYLIDAGDDVIPVNPGQEEILGRKCYPTLAAVPGPVDIVDIFRSPEHVPPIVEEAIAARAKVVWMQLG